jgi:hypothetical protein
MGMNDDVPRSRAGHRHSVRAQGSGFAVVIPMLVFVVAPAAGIFLAHFAEVPRMIAAPYRIRIILGKHRERRQHYESDR